MQGNLGILISKEMDLNAAAESTDVLKLMSLQLELTTSTTNIPKNSAVLKLLKMRREI